MGLTGFSRVLANIAGVLLGVSGIYASRADIGVSVADLMSALGANPVSATLILLALGLLVWANWALVKRVLGFSRSNAEWKRQITQWTHEERKWELVESESDTENFRVVFRVPITDKNNRTVTVSRPGKRQRDLIGIAAGVALSDDHRARLSKAPKDYLLDLRDELILAFSVRSIDVEMKIEDGMPTRIGLMTAFPSDNAITELEFIQKVQDVTSAADTVVVLIARAARKVPTEGAEPLAITPGAQ